MLSLGGFFKVFFQFKKATKSDKFCTQIIFIHSIIDAS